MKESYIKLLKKRIEKLSSEDFDLESWKSGTTSVLERTFGENDPSIKKIDDLKIDYSSWALRDATSTYNPMETCKKKGKEILETLIEEIELVGLPLENSDPGSKFIDQLGKKSEEVKEIIESGDEKKLKKELKSSSKDDLVNILSKILLK